MPEIAPQNAETSRGERLASARLEPTQRRLFEPPKPSYRWFLRELVAPRFAAVAVEIFRERCGDDVIAAEKNLSKVLSHNGNGNGKRHFDVSWLDALIKVLGPEAQERILAFLCDRWGFEPPARLPDPIREEERIQKLEKAISSAGDLIGAATQELAAIRRLREKAGGAT